MHGARAARRVEQGGFTLLAILVVLAALTLVVGMALQRGEDERRSAYLVQHDALALSAAEFGLDRTRVYVGAILNKETDLDKVLDPGLNTNCGSLPQFDGGTADDHLPAFAGGSEEQLGGADRPFLSFPYDANEDGEPEGAYLVRIEDNDDDADPTAFTSSTNNNDVFGCREGPGFVNSAAGTAARTNPVRDRDRTVIVTVVGISPGTDPARAQARKVLRARIGSAPAAGLIAGGTIDLSGASHVCGAYGSIAVNDGGFEDGCVCGGNCKGGPSHQSCGNGNTCNVQVSGSTCNVDFGGGGGTCTTGAPVPASPKVEVWSRLNAPPACPASSPTCTPFYFMHSVPVSPDAGTSTGGGGGGGGGGAVPLKPQVWMWDYTASVPVTLVGKSCANPQSFDRIYYPGELSSPADPCWKLVYEGGKRDCPTDKVRVADSPALSARTTPALWSCGPLVIPVPPAVWDAPESLTPKKGTTGCDSSAFYPGGVNRYTRDWDVEGPAPGGNFNKSAFTYQPNPNPLPAIIPIPRGVWMVDGNLAFGTSTPPTSLQPPVTVLSTGTVRVDNNSKVFLRPVTRDVSLLAGRDLFLGGGTMLLTCGEPTPTLTGCPSAAIMVYEQVSLGANSHLQGQLVVESGGKCSEDVEGKAVSNGGNATISVPAMPPIYSPGGAVVLSWGESSL